MYRTELTPRARRELDALSEEVFEQVDRVISGLSEQPRPRGAIKLKGPIYRVRTGRWRIIYSVFDRDQLIIVGKVARRAEDTYDQVEALF